MSRDFVYHNENPYRIEEQDCVCRAISKALDLEYETTKQLLTMSAEVNDCDELCVCCYHHLLENVFNLPVRYCQNWERVGDIAKMFRSYESEKRKAGALDFDDLLIYTLELFTKNPEIRKKWQDEQ